MNIRPRPIDGLWEVIGAPPFRDERGSLQRTYDAEAFRSAGIEVTWVEQSISSTRSPGVLRGLHLQIPPFSEAKLITILSGRMFWVAVDIRKGSPSFGRWDAVSLGPDGITGLFARRGFAHGCLSLTGDCTLLIDADNRYSREYGTGIAWDDPELAIAWPLGGRTPILSAEHRAYPGFGEFKARYGGISVQETP